MPNRRDTDLQGHDGGTPYSCIKRITGHIFNIDSMKKTVCQ